jgi:hypothetical protein
VKVVEGNWIYNFPVHHILHFDSKILGKTRSNVDAPTRLGQHRAGPHRAALRLRARRAALASGRWPVLLGRAPCLRLARDTRPQAPRLRAPSRLGGRAAACSALRRRTAVGAPGRPAVRPLLYGVWRLFKGGSVISLCTCTSPSPSLVAPLLAPASTCRAAALPAAAAPKGQPTTQIESPAVEDPPSSSSGRERRRTRRIPASRAGHRP